MFMCSCFHSQRVSKCEMEEFTLNSVSLRSAEPVLRATYSLPALSTFQRIRPPVRSVGLASWRLASTAWVKCWHLRMCTHVVGCVVGCVIMRVWHEGTRLDEGGSGREGRDTCKLRIVGTIHALSPPALSPRSLSLSLHVHVRACIPSHTLD